MIDYIRITFVAFPVFVVLKWLKNWSIFPMVQKLDEKVKCFIF